MEVPILIYCADGNPRFMAIAKKYGFLTGAQLPRTIYDVHKPLYFADQDFKRPRYVDYIRALKRNRPYIASVLDIMEWRRLDEYMMRAEEISQYCTEIMIIPKVDGFIATLPKEIRGKKIRLGYSVFTKFGGTKVPVGEFRGWPIHLLGGSPVKQIEKLKEMREVQASVVSADGNYAQKLSKHAQFFFPEILWDEEYKNKVEQKLIKNPIWPTLLEYNGFLWPKDAPYEAFERSCKNIMEYWNAQT